jgi:hypothetical protein
MHPHTRLNASNGVLSMWFMDSIVVHENMDDDGGKLWKQLDVNEDT